MGRKLEKQSKPGLTMKTVASCVTVSSVLN